MATKKTDTAIEIRPLDIRRVPLTIVCDTPLIVHAWSEKAKRMMLEAQMGLSKGKKKEYKNPVEDFINSMYWLSGKPEEYTEDAFTKAVAEGARFGFPATAVKAAAVSAAYRQGWSKNKVVLQGEMFIESDADGMIEIKTDEPPVMREDMVKVGMGTADLRYRGEFRNWRADIVLRYNANGQFSLENIVNIINAGGFFCGIGEWRPEKGGTNGMYHVE
jgi:hypothetical protein